MAKKRKKISESEAERAAHDARVEEHIRRVYERADEVFAEYGEKRPDDIVAYVYERYDRPADL
jgi:hypothetical protein